jgi:hypothetical protein
MIKVSPTRRRAAHAAPKGPAQRRSFTAGVAVAIAIGLVAGAAYAFVKSTGSGSNAGKVGHLTAIVVEHATGTPASRLFPGSNAGLALTITNPNTASVTITGIAADGTVTASGGTGCTSSNAAVTVRTLTGLNVALAHGTHSVTIATGAAMGSGAVTGCQGATFHLPVTVTVHE